MATATAMNPKVRYVTFIDSPIYLTSAPQAQRRIAAPRVSEGTYARPSIRLLIYLENLGNTMSKEDSIEVTGTVVEKFPSGLFSVQLDQDRIVLAHLAGKLRRNRIRVLAGDRVTLELSPYDLTKGRITYRHK